MKNNGFLGKKKNILGLGGIAIIIALSLINRNCSGMKSLKLVEL